MLLIPESLLLEGRCNDCSVTLEPVVKTFLLENGARNCRKPKMVVYVLRALFIEADKCVGVIATRAKSI